MWTTIVLTAALCLVFWGCCFMSTGTDEKNLRSYATYPKEVQDYVRSNPAWKEQIRKANLLVSPNPVKTFLANALLFLIVLFLLGSAVRTDRFAVNFVQLSVMGQGLNLFDYAVIDLLWWRNAKRIRFSGTENDVALYRNPTKHTVSFVKGVAMFGIVALVDAALLTLF